MLVARQTSLMTQTRVNHARSSNFWTASCSWRAGKMRFRVDRLLSESFRFIFFAYSHNLSLRSNSPSQTYVK